MLWLHLELVQAEGVSDRDLKRHLWIMLPFGVQVRNVGCFLLAELIPLGLQVLCLIVYHPEVLWVALRIVTSVGRL